MPFDKEIEISPERDPNGEGITFTMTDIPDDTTEEDIEKYLLDEGLLMTVTEQFSEQDAEKAHKMANMPLLDPIADMGLAGPFEDSVDMSLRLQGFPVDEGSTWRERAMASLSSKIGFFGGNTAQAASDALSITYNEENGIQPTSEDWVQIPVQEHYVEIKGHGEVPVLVFQNPRTNRWELFNKPNFIGSDAFSISDVAGFTGDGLVIAGDMAGATLGGILGLVTGGPTGAALGAFGGAGTGAFLGTWGKYALGVQAGMNTGSDEEIIRVWKESLLNAGIASGGIAISGAFIRAGKWFVNTVLGRKFDATQAELGLTDEEMAQFNQFKEWLESYGVKFSPRASQVGSEELRAFEKPYKEEYKLGYSRPFREQDEANMRELEVLRLRLEERAGAIRAEGGSGAEIQRIIDQEVLAAEKRGIEDKLIMAHESALLKPAKGAVSTPEGTGITLRGVAEQEQQAFRELWNGKWDEFMRDDIIGTSAPLQSWAVKEHIRQDRAILRSLRSANIKVVDDVIRIMDDGGAVTLRQVEEALQDVNTHLQPGISGFTSDSPQINVLKQLKKALKQTRKDMLESHKATIPPPKRLEDGSYNYRGYGIRKDADGKAWEIVMPDNSIVPARSKREAMKHVDSFEGGGSSESGQAILNRITRLEQEYSEAKKAIDDSIIGAIMRRDAQGHLSLANKDIVDFLFVPHNEAAVGRLMDATKDNPVARNVLRQEFWAFYKKRVFGRRPGRGSPVSEKVADPFKHDEFMRDYGKMAEELLTPNQYSLLKTSGRQRVQDMEKALLRYDESLRILQRRVDSNLLSIEPELLAKQVADGVGARKAVTLRQMLQERHPEVWGLFKGDFAEEIATRMMNPNTGGMDFQLLRNVLNNRDLIGTMEVIMGKDYVRGLRGLQKALEMIQKESTVKGATRTSGATSIWRDTWRAIFFPPLTRGGRVFSAVEEGRRTLSTDRLARALESPEKLLEMINASRLGFDTKTFINSATSAGMLELFTGPDYL